ncbi:MAG: FkbM family methyltransferase [Chloroflexota bacterium]
MPKSFSAILIKGIEYFSLPFQYPHRFLPLLGKLLTQRSLVHEMPRLTPQMVWFQKMGIQTVLDVGSYIGSFAYAIRHILPDAHIYSFEPLEDNYAQLVKNLTPLGNFQAFNTAIGEQTGEMDFHRSDFSPSSSVLEMGELHRQTFPQSAHSTSIVVPVARLDDYLGQINLDPPVFLKIDVQGYEDAVLRGAKQVLKRVDFLEIEVSYQPLYSGQVLFEGIHQLLIQADFHFAGNLDSMFSPLDGSILQSDALFIRNK